MFLDEIGELSVPLQAKLVHVLQDGEFWSFGARRDVDVRIVAATTRDLDQAVASGQFREDLFGRLNIVSINMPPLRERLDDVPSLVGYFLKKYAVRYNKPGVDVSPETMGLLADYDWPGNIRELENLIKRAVVLGTEAPLRQVSLQSSMVSRAPSARQSSDAGRDSLRRRRRRQLLAQGDLADRGARGGARAHFQGAAADAVEPEGNGGDPQDQLQGSPL